MEYKLGIVAVVALLVLVVVLFVVFSKRSKKKEEKVEVKEQESQASQLQKEEIEKEKEKEEDVVVEEVTQEVTQEKEDGFKPKFTKQPVPEHAKVTKEDFQEFQGRRILLAEDNIINQKVILGLLGDSGIDIVIANDGQEALDILKTDDDFMVILMDAHMPNVDGFEATRAIRKNRQYDHIVIVALSGDTASDDIKKMKAAGMDETLEKPLKIDDFYDVLYAYNTTPARQEEPALVEESSSILNTQEGLSVCGNDDGFYKDLLKEFIEDYGSSDQTLQTYIQEKNYESADKLLLDVIGVTANLGANKIHDIALNAKGNFQKDGDSLVNRYKEALQETLEAMRAYLS